jgi:hypothetical protein
MMGVFRLVLRGSGWRGPPPLPEEQTNQEYKKKIILTHPKIWRAPEHGNVPSYYKYYVFGHYP